METTQSNDGAVASAGDGRDGEWPRLMIVIASTRPGRVGLPVGEWFRARATRHGGFGLDFADLAAIDLPFLDEPNHPRLHQYTQPHTFAWSARVDAADAFVFVMPEYNHGFNAPLKNAIDYLNREWAYKPVGFVSYGGVAGGTRAVQLLKPVLAVLKLVPLPEAVPIPFVHRQIDDEGRFQATEAMEEAAGTMLDELARWVVALRPLRAATEAAT
jgi:NAD(P)H-dependent FMN reductase